MLTIFLLVTAILFLHFFDYKAASVSVVPTLNSKSSPTPALIKTQPAPSQSKTKSSAKAQNPKKSNPVNFDFYNLLRQSQPENKPSENKP